MAIIRSTAAEPTRASEAAPCAKRSAPWRWMNWSRGYSLSPLHPIELRSHSRQAGSWRKRAGNSIGNGRYDESAPDTRPNGHGASMEHARSRPGEPLAISDTDRAGLQELGE